MNRLRSLVLQLVVTLMVVTAAAAAPPVPPPTGAVRGTIRYDGKAPKPAAIKPSKDPEVCGKPPLSDETLLVGAKGGLANALVWLEGVPGPAPAVSAVVVHQVGCRYLPHVQGAVVGSDLVLTNGDAILHNVHAYKDDVTAFNLALPVKGARAKEKLDSAGLYLLKCDAGHTWMSAHVMAFEHRYFTVTGADGQFALSGVPPGKYPVQVWHERLGTLSGAVEVTAGGTATLTLAFKGK